MTSHMNGYTPVAEIVPPGEQGVAKIEHFEIGKKESEFTSMRAAFGRPSEFVPEGKYVRLEVKHGLMMTDTRMEQATNMAAVRAARGDVLIAGLGIGMVLIPILKKPEVKSVIVIEKYQDVIDLVMPALMAKIPEAKDKLKVACWDALTWVPPRGAKWDCIYFDIWPDICVDNLKDITLLKRRFARRKNPDGWMGAWVEDKLRYEERRSKRRGW